ncbi:hypothetical protein EDB81DRAFT_672204 [Dactylonectria macrodidyma]|uniref:Transcription factor domain-containing protein n=1 Tax=Dactylonectria macrodidyma TaxID=307937 RepID=A0A9P9I8B2_9HYPO|nr:hypothetical protein EDB81DRAFT_672204 [Dactylonectria macrodidyma]
MWWRRQTETSVELLFDPLLTQAKAIWEKLLYSSQPSTHGLVFDDQGTTNQCIELFNPKNLRRLLNTYWTRWHYHCPIIHRASLDLAHIPTEMIMVMCLLGACVSLDSSDAEKARQWLDPTEAFIFSLPWLSRDKAAGETVSQMSCVTKLRLLQTGLLICVL